MQQLRDLQQNRSNEKNDDILLDRLTRLDADINVASEALVSRERVDICLPRRLLSEPNSKTFRQSKNTPRRQSPGPSPTATGSATHSMLRASRSLRS